MHSDVLIIIPARLASTRLPEKPLKLIGKLPMIQHVYARGVATGIKHIYVTTDSEMIQDVIEHIGGKVIITEAEIPSGTDRVYAAYCKLDIPGIKYVINLQGDMPFIDPQNILTLIEGMKKSEAEITTLAASINKEDAIYESNVKVVTNKAGSALYFSRSLIPNGASKFLYHIGAYGFTVAALEKFVKLPHSYLEKNEKLEQLRALENGMDIQVCEVSSVPISVDTDEDLQKAITYYHEHFRERSKSTHF